MKNYFILSILLFAVYDTRVNAQLSRGGVPASFTLKEKAELAEVPFEIMPAVDVEVLRAEDVYNDQIKDQPWRFGKDLFVSLNPDNSGVWDNLPDGGRLWRLGITSRGALTINLTFDNYRLPEGATLFIYNADKSVVLGAYTSLNNQDDRYFAVSPIPGESIVIEYFEPADAEFHGELNLWRVTHGYRGLVEYQKAFGEAGTCNVNAVCPQGDPIRDQIKSAAIMFIGGTLCSGALINNTNNDGIPLFLSANHCYGTPGTIVFWFNWQSATCSNPPSSPPYNSLSGATQRARYITSDFWLMELNQTPPAEYNVYYLGWNRTTDATIPGTVWCIHHPSGDIKKISWATGGVTTSEYLGNTGSGTNHWRVGMWSDGTTTEGGSSGSPLVDPQYRVIGQLHGGYAACENTLPDWYGKLGTSWTGGGTDASRLSTWLDPVGTGAMILDGYDPNKSTLDGEVSEILSPVSFYGDTGSVVPEIVLHNAGTQNITAATLQYRIDFDTAVLYDWTGDLPADKTDTIRFDTISLTWGTHSITAKVTIDGDENPSDDSITLEFQVLDCYNQTLPLDQYFNDTLLPPCWDTATVSGSDGIISFVTEGTNPTSIPGEGTGMVEFNSFTASVGSEVRLISPGISSISFEGINVSFKWLHDANYAANNDKVIVQYSFDGSAWNDVQEILRYNASLSGWYDYTIPMPVDVEDTSLVFVGFLFHSEKGNNCHMDSISITGTITGPYCDFIADTTFAYVLDTITFSDASLNGPFTTWDWDFGYGAEPQTAVGEGPHKVVYNIPGRKSISLLVDGTYSRTKIDYLTIDPLNFFPPGGLTAFINTDRDIQLMWDMTYFFDGFESGDFSLWDEVIEGSGTPGEGGYAHWFVQSDSLQYIYDGSWSALVNWGYNINTWIIIPEVEVTDVTLLSFIWTSSYSWHVDPFDHGDLFVRISDDDGQSWTTVWTFGEIGLWDNWVWYQTVIDLSAFSGQTLKIAFNLVADDNADVAMDNVMILRDAGKSYVGTTPVSEPLSAEFTSKSVRGNDLQKNIQLNAPLAPKGTLSSYSVYRDGEEITETAENSYLDEDLKPGTYIYYVIANYINPVGSSEPSNEVEVYLGPDIIEPKFNGSSITLYPNPSSGLFTLSADKEYLISIMNSNGMKLGEIEVRSDTRSIDLSRFDPGIYLLHFRSDDASFVIKVLIR